MRFSTYINNQKLDEWDLEVNQGALIDLINQSSSWAEPIAIDGKIYYWVSRGFVIDQLPRYYKKVDTVYRHFKELDKKGIIEYRKVGDKDLILLTEKGKQWNELTAKYSVKSSDSNPTLGTESEETRIEIRKSSDSNPTYKNINNKIINNNTPLPPKGEVANATPSPPKKPIINYSEIADVFNRCVKDSGKDLSLIANPNALSDKRKRAIKKLASVFKKRDKTYEHHRLVEYFADYFEYFLQSATTFYFGDNIRKWRADFEYILRETTFDKTIEGNL
ncbi:hypothetical protein [Phocoenobacter skyensis]|uniref:Uncharacterized protein n=1 Tax=Phocoenobacter skyensis TaxID=97481 RepID=A0ABT9JIV3_9PAST|nr:hypothetical protein [Pasteurella skyensis]MDP8078356.1 hypothetical protein [Pasteurella skyensis]MDP8084552.1 hypothetical protein [Pasteurella skyensis]